MSKPSIAWEDTLTLGEYLEDRYGYRVRSRKGVVHVKTNGQLLCGATCVTNRAVHSELVTCRTCLRLSKQV